MLFSSVEKAFLTEDCRAVRGDQHPPGYGNSLPTDDSGTPEGFDQTIQDQRGAHGKPSAPSPTSVRPKSSRITEPIQVVRRSRSKHASRDSGNLEYQTQPRNL